MPLFTLTDDGSEYVTAGIRDGVPFVAVVPSALLAPIVEERVTGGLDESTFFRKAQEAITEHGYAIRFTTLTSLAGLIHVMQTLYDDVSEKEALLQTHAADHKVH